MFRQILLSYNEYIFFSLLDMVYIINRYGEDDYQKICILDLLTF